MERTINFAKLEGAKGQRERRGRNSDQLIGWDPAVGQRAILGGCGPDCETCPAYICGHVRTEGGMDDAVKASSHSLEMRRKGTSLIVSQGVRDGVANRHLRIVFPERKACFDMSLVSNHFAVGRKFPGSTL